MTKSISIKYLVSSIKLMLFLLSLNTYCLILTTAYAVTDPLAVPNNRFGIHLIQATPDESSPAAQLVNSSGGDWGYVTILIERKDKKPDKWQSFFDDLRRRHLIPIVRIATEPDAGSWKLPDPGEEQSWADFLNSLNWPVKNRYVVVYNEPNHGAEWGGVADPRSYARVLSKTIIALKARSADFFVLNAGLDQSAPHHPPSYFDQLSFMLEMERSVPGIFNLLDGWVSHSYPNPGFVSSPDGVGRGTVRGWYWELQTLRALGVTKNLAVFIAETGWKHSEGLLFDPSLPTPETVAINFQQAFQNAWSSPQIVAITPFLLSYQESPFDHFSWQRLKSKEFYPHYLAVQSLDKIAGAPVQINSAELTRGEIFSSVVAGEQYLIPMTFRNTGQSIWNESTELRIKNIELSIEEAVGIFEGQQIEPGQEYTFYLPFSTKLSAENSRTTVQLYQDNREFDSSRLVYQSTVKSPVVLKIKGGLNWKQDFQGQYLLTVKSIAGTTTQLIQLDTEGNSAEIEARYLLPDYQFEFTLSRPFYHPKNVRTKVFSGPNTLEFPHLQPNLLELILRPKDLWQALPFSK